MMNEAYEELKKQLDLAYIDKHDVFLLSTDGKLDHRATITNRKGHIALALALLADQETEMLKLVAITTLFNDLLNNCREHLDKKYVNKMKSRILKFNDLDNLFDILVEELDKIDSLIDEKDKD